MLLLFIIRSVGEIVTKGEIIAALLFDDDSECRLTLQFDDDSEMSDEQTAGSFFSYFTITRW